MGMFEQFKQNLAGNKAIRTHSAAQQEGKKGNKEKAKQQYALAAQLYEEALAAGCTMPKVYMSYAILLMRDGNNEKAKDLMLKAEKIPNIADADKKQLLINYGVCQWKLGNLDKAIELMKSAENRGKCSAIYMMLGHLLLEKAEQTGDYSEAEAYIAEAYDYDTDDPEGMDLMAQWYLSQGDTENAKKYFNMAVKKDPSQGWSFAYLAHMAEDAGDTAEAAKYMEKSVNGEFHLMSPIAKKDARAYAEKLGVQVPED